MTSTHDVQRDPQLSALLRAAVDAPPLRAGFHEELETRLAAAGRAGVTSIPARRRRVTTRRLVTAAAVAAAAAVLAFAVLPALRDADTATAGDVLAAMTASSGGAQTVRMHVVTKTAIGAHDERAVDTADLTMGIRGDSLAEVTSTWSLQDDEGRTQGHTTTQTFGYDEARHESRKIPGAGLIVKSASIRRPAWQQEPAIIGDYTGVYSTLAAQVRAGLAETTASMPVRETTYLGRPAWRCVFTVHERWGVDNEVAMTFHWDATVDQATGLLVAASWAMDANGKRQPMAWDLRVTSLELDPDLPNGWQLPKPTGAKVTVIDEGTRFGTPEEVAARSWPTLPLIPQWAPPGYRRTDVASAGFNAGDGYPGWSAAAGRLRLVSRKGDVTYKRAEWPMDDQTVLVRFRRGFSSFTVQVTPKPFGTGFGSGEPDVTLSGGYLAGKPAYFADDGSDGMRIGISTPKLIAYSDRSRVVISGDLTRDELVKVANSLKAYGDVDRPLTLGY